MLPLAELISFTGQNSNLHGCRLYEISFYRIFWFILDEFVANVCLYLPWRAKLISSEEIIPLVVK